MVNFYLVAVLFLASFPALAGAGDPNLVVDTKATEAAVLGTGFCAECERRKTMGNIDCGQTDCDSSIMASEKDLSKPGTVTQ